jgi:hypothetical protein
MGLKLTDKLAKTLDVPAAGNRIYPDEDVKGFGVRVTYAGARSFILNYRAAGRERRITIGSFPDWTVSAARERARELKRRIDVGDDPLAERHRERAAPTVARLEHFNADWNRGLANPFRSMILVFPRRLIGRRQCCGDEARRMGKTSGIAFSPLPIAALLLVRSPKCCW